MKFVIITFFIVVLLISLYCAIKGDAEYKKRVADKKICRYCKHYNRFFKFCRFLKGMATINENDYCNRWE